jgi:hypothetical protein
MDNSRKVGAQYDLHATLWHLEFGGIYISRKFVDLHVK